MSKIINQNKFNIKNIILAFAFLVVSCAVLGSAIISKADATASGTSVIVTVNYINETATVAKGTGGSVKFYITTDKKLITWDLMESSDPANIVDISTYLSTKEVSIFFKGDKDTKATEVKLQAEDKTLKITPDIKGEVIKFTEEQKTATPSQLEYRKGVKGNWIPVTGDISTSMYSLRGVTLYFRTKATADKRAGKIMTVKIAKAANAPSVKVDGSKLEIKGLKSGVSQYRVNDGGWIDFKPASDKTKTLDILPLTTADKTFIEVRIKATDKKIASKIRNLEVLEQVAFIDTKVKVLDSTITVEDATSKNKYEYTIVKANASISLSTAKWSSISSTKPITIKKIGKIKLAVGDKLYIRKASTVDTFKNVVLASEYKEYIINKITETGK